MDNKQTILIVGSGGREHALAWKLAQLPRVGKIYVAPGNGGTSQIAENVPIPATDIEKLVAFALTNKIDFTVIGPDDPLAGGIVDRFKEAGLKVFGPTKAAAQLEASKAFAKAFMAEQGIPTARFQTFSDYQLALAYVRSQPIPLVVKASGLALGKGVTVCRTLEEAEASLKAIMVERVFGEAGNEVVIEEFLEGQEVSIHAFSDGEHFKLLPTAQDHKPIFDGDQGPNTGGMGTIAPVPWVTEEMIEEVSQKIVAPVLKGMKERGEPFSGLLYPGIVTLASLKLERSGPKLSSEGGVKVLEFNVRFGDPETQSYMRLLKTDLLDILEACTDGTLDKQSVECNAGFAVCIVLASGGYPGKYEKGKEITGIEEAEKIPDVVVFHAGTAIKDGQLVTAGGRVLGVTATGETLKMALDRAYQAVRLIRFDGMQYRKDIGAKALHKNND